MSNHHLRDTLGLQDGDTLEFTVIEASGESGKPEVCYMSGTYAPGVDR